MALDCGLLGARYPVQQVLRRQVLRSGKRLEATYKMIEAIFKSLAEKAGPDEVADYNPYQSTLVCIDNSEDSIDQLRRRR